MGVASELAVKFTADTSGLEAGGQKAEGLIGRMTSGLGKLGLAGMGVGAITGAVGRVVGSFGDLIGAAESAGDAKARLDVVLGSDLSGVIEDNATIANSLGLTKTAYLEATGAASNYFVNLGVGKDAAADMAMGMTELAPKLAAFTGMDPTAAMDALQKGVAGSTRGLKEMGIAIDTDAISKLDDAGKAQAIYEQILAQSTGATEAWADNQGDVANSMARVSAAMDDAKAAIGEGLLPLIAPLAEKFAGLASTISEGLGQAFTALSSGDIAGAIDEIGSAFGLPVSAIEKLMTAADALSGVFDSMMTGWRDAGGSFQSVSDVIDGLVGMFVELLASVGVNDDMLETIIVTIAALRDKFNEAIAVVTAVAAKFTEFAGGPGKLMQTVIGTVLVVAFGALAYAAGAAAISIIAALAPILIPIAAIVAAVVVLRKAWDTNFGGIREKTAAVVEWITTNVGPAITSMVETVKAVLGGMADWWASNGDMIIGIVKGIWDTVAGLFQVAFATIKGLVSIFLNVIHGNFEGAGKALISMWGGIGAGLVRAFKGLAVALLGTIATLTKNTVEAFIALGGMILTGLINGLKAAPAAFANFMAGMAKAAIAAFKAQFGIKSPSKVMEGIGENVVEGLRIGMSGLAELSGIINETLGRIIGDADRENFKSIAELTSSLLDIFTNTTKAIRALLDFDITTSAAQISKQFDALVGTFQTALLRMKGLAQYAGRGDSPLDFLNMFDVQNIEIVSKGFDATIGLINGVLDIAAKLQTVKVPNAADIEALFEPLSKLGNVAARFIDSVGTPEGEDATAYFNQGATTAAALASWAKSIADIVGIKFGAVAAEFEAQMNAAADASVKAWNAVKDMAEEWGDKGVSEREKLLTGIQAYATVVGAAAGILKAGADLDLSKMVKNTADQLKAAADASVAAVGELARVADWWIRAGEKVTAPIIEGMKAYADAASAAVGLLKTAGELDLSKMVAVTTAQLHDAADASLAALGELGRVAAAFVSMGAEARTALVQAVKDYAEAAGAAVGLLGGAASLDFTKAVAVTGQQLHDAADATLAALGELQRVAAGFVTMGHEATGPLVESIKDFAEGAGAAVDLLVKGAQGMNALGEIKRLSGIQPRLIRTILKQLRDVVDIVTDPKNAPKTPTEEQLAALKSLGDSSGVFDGIVNAAAGMNELGQVKRLSGVQPRLIRTVLSQLSTVIGIVADPKTALKPITSEQAAAIKAIGDSSGVLSSLSSVADGFAKMSGKLSIPSDLSERVATLIDAMRTVVNGIAGAMTGEGAINLKDAVAGADIAEAVGRIGDAFGPIFDAINAAIESPFGRIKATGQRGDTFRQNIANRIKASLVAAVTALSEALGSMPAITIPDGLSEQIDKLAGIYDRILDVIGKLDGVKIDTRAVASLAAALGVLAGGVGGIGPGNISVTGGGSQLSVASGPGGGIVINNEFNPTLTPLPITINTTNNISVSGKVVESIATEVQQLQELKLRQGGTP